MINVVHAKGGRSNIAAFHWEYSSGEETGASSEMGSVWAMTDDWQVVAKSYTYEAFGKLWSEAGSGLLFENRYSYTAREGLGDALGLYYYRWRVMDPTVGRFTSEDPLGFVDGANLCVYVRNRSVSVVDPLGKSAVPPGLPQLPAELVTEAYVRTVGGLLGTACAAKYCEAVKKNKKYEPITWNNAWLTCFDLANEHNIPTGNPPVTDSAANLNECADVCVKITKKKKFREVCCGKEKQS